MTERDRLQQQIFNIIGIRADKPKSIPAAKDENQKIPMPADKTKSDGISKCTTFNNARKILTKKLCCTPAHADENDNIYKDGNYVTGSTMPNDENNRIYRATCTETLKLTELGKARRGLTGDAIINVLTKKLAEITSIDEVDKKYPVYRICTLIAMWVSLKISSNTSDFVIPYDNVCKVILKGGVVKYKSLEGEYWQVNADTKKKLNVQLCEDISTPLELSSE
ncbi:uncharacterized protein LOC126837487 [Adelges cooleyi]|uniref:uncharacterized protein LOC126837487 n=1 Tax=Adelges cooleyi TaxID=133065 RepID=UPI0021801FB4|nr:uncharacterized protein LOC126837487 [Adelges cooleyi]